MSAARMESNRGSPPVRKIQRPLFNILTPKISVPICLIKKNKTQMYNIVIQVASMLPFNDLSLY